MVHRIESFLSPESHQRNVLVLETDAKGNEKARHLMAPDDKSI
jgi:hypothetical protein